MKQIKPFVDNGNRCFSYDLQDIREKFNEIIDAVNMLIEKRSGPVSFDPYKIPYECKKCGFTHSKDDGCQPHAVKP